MVGVVLDNDRKSVKKLPQVHSSGFHKTNMLYYTIIIHVSYKRLFFIVSACKAGFLQSYLRWY
jgi:hypothetical protein